MERELEALAAKLAKRKHDGGKSLTLEERWLIKQLRDQGIGYKRIAKSLGRSTSTVRHELHRHNKNGVYDPEYAHEMVEANKHNAIAKTQNRLEALENSVSALEQHAKNIQKQIDIFFDIIKEIQGNGKH